MKASRRSKAPAHFTQRGLLNVDQFAVLTGWSPGTVRQKVWKREVEFVRMGRSIRFKPETVERLIQENTVYAK
jgi:excisionase family DNA binding protein